MNVTFRDASNNTIGNAISIGNFVAANRNNRTGLLGADFNGLVPVGTRSALVELLMTRAAGTNNDGYADNLSLILSGGATTPDLDQHGLTGSWYEPETSGQGLEVEDFPDLSAPGSGLIQVSWFTFDDTVGAADHERWYTASGPVVAGQSIANLTIYQNVGGNFDAPPVTSAQAVGKATLSFDTCASGVFSYTFNDGSGRAGVIPLTRLTQNVTCSTTSVPRTDPDFALSGNWFDPATSGQGLMIEVNPNSHALFAAWYTYAPGGAGAGAAGQRWFTAEGDFVAGARLIPITIYETTLGLFDAATFPFPSTVAVGSGTLTFQSCADAVLNFDFTGGSSSGMPPESLAWSGWVRCRRDASCSGTQLRPPAACRIRPHCTHGDAHGPPGRRSRRRRAERGDYPTGWLG